MTLYNPNIVPMYNPHMKASTRALFRLPCLVPIGSFDLTSEKGVWSEPAGTVLIWDPSKLAPAHNLGAKRQPGQVGDRKLLGCLLVGF